MSRKVIANKVIDKSKIKKRQEEISRSVNESETINQKLINDNTRLLEEINKKEEQRLFIEQKTLELIESKEIAEKNYIKSKDKLDDLLLSLKNTETKNQYKLDGIKELQKEYKDRELELSISFKKEEKSLDNKIKKLKDTVLDTMLEKNKLDASNKELIESNKQLVMKANKNTNNIKEQEKTLKSIKSEIEKNEDVYFSSNLQKQIIQTEVLDLEDKKEQSTKDLNKINKELSKTNDSLIKAKEELEKIKDKNLVLIGREEKVRAREVYITQYYEKAGKSINL